MSNDNYFSAMRNGNSKFPSLQLLPDMAGIEEGIKLAKVHGIDVRQNFFGKIFNYGTLIVKTVDGNSAPFRFFKKPAEFQANVRDQIVLQMKQNLPELINFVNKLKSEEPEIFS